MRSMPRDQRRSQLDPDADMVGDDWVDDAMSGGAGNSRKMIEDIMRAEAARREQLHADPNARSEIPGTVEFFMKYGPSYREGEQIPGRSWAEGGMLPLPGEVEERMQGSMPGTAPDFNEYPTITEQDI